MIVEMLGISTAINIACRKAMTPGTGALLNYIASVKRNCCSK
jgi:hypothetical protein